MEGGTQVELADAHRDLKAPPYTLSRHTNLYSVILYYFPTIVKLIAASALSNALLGRRQQDSLAVIQDWDLLLTSNRNEVAKQMYSYRLKAIKNYKDAFKLIRATKKKRFNSRLYFYYINNGINPLTITVDLSRVPPIIMEG